MSLFKHFSVNSIKIRKNLGLKQSRLERISPYVSLIQTLANNRTFIRDHHKTIKQQDWITILWRIEMNMEIF